jgi:hypothetical protein
MPMKKRTGAVTEATAARIFPDVLRRIQLGRMGRQRQDHDIVWLGLLAGVLERLD